MNEPLIALAGNPNAGKTSLFNAITGARQHVANYPGVTVERREGLVKRDGREVRLVDLPGTYSLTAYSLEELVARNVLLEEHPGVVVNIVDASNLERNLYLTVQLLELGLPVVVALNMIDVAEGRGVRINADLLSRRLGVPVVATVARSGRGKNELMSAALEASERGGRGTPLVISYGPDIDPVLAEMEARIAAEGFLARSHPARWTALKYLESDEEVMKKGRRSNAALSEELERMVARVSEHIEKTLDTYPEAIIADYRYGAIASILKSGVVRKEDSADRLYLSDKLDRVFTHRLIGPVVMVAVLYLLYTFTFSVSEVPVGWLEAGFSALSGFLESVLPEGPVRSLIVSGIIDGVGGILGFVPIIVFMFVGVSILEDSGYLARAAYMLDRVFRVFGLHGSSLMAYVVGGGIAGGCAVPGVMATRTLQSSKERLATILTVSYMNCGAKLPVFALLIGAFFAENQAGIMLLLTLIAWGFALVIARIFRSTILKGPSTPFLMELPPYRLPTVRGILIHTWERVWLYVKKAGTVLLGVSIILWALMNYPGLPDEEKTRYQGLREQAVESLPEESRAPALAGELQREGLPEESSAVLDKLAAIDHEEAQHALKNSLAGRMGTALETVTRYSGFDWRTNVALVGGFAAKEVVVSTLGTAYSLGSVDAEEATPLSEQLATDPAWNPLTAFALILFCMLYSPCVVSVVCIAKEAGGWKWAAFSVVFNTVLAFTAAIVVYQGGKLLGLGI